MKRTSTIRLPTVLAILTAALISISACCPPSVPTAETDTPRVTLPSVTVPSATELPTEIVLPTPVPVHPIQVRQVDGRAEFYDQRTGERFVPRGVNYFYIVPVSYGLEDRFFGVDVFDAERVDADFAMLSERGFNTVRIFLDSCSRGRGCMGNPDGPGLNPPYLDNIVETMRLAKAHNLYLLLTSNDLPDLGDYASASAGDVDEFFAPYRNSQYLTSAGIEAARTYWGDLLQALAARGAPFDAVLAWSLLNEQWYIRTDPPFSLDEGTVTTANGESYDLSDPAQKKQMAVDGMVYYIDQVREVILSHDPTALITMGFFAPDYPNPLREGDWRYVETAPLLETAALDFFDFHPYPGDRPLWEHAENYGMIGFEAKPIIMGEIGAFINRYPSEESAARAIQDWVAESCEYGFDGWLYWGLYRAPEAIGDATWGFLDGDRLAMQALSPINQPDPCNPEPLPRSNLAFGKAAVASRSLPEEPPEQAVDGQPTQWESGDYAPQWIQVDLGTPAAVKQVRLVVAQWPAGETVHQIWGGGSSGDLSLLHEFRGQTEDGQVLEFTPHTPLEGVQIVRIITLESPSWVSWKEIEVIGKTELGSD
ncbi:MAG: discoidin domain-containing protein [Anaerolineae bacterium]